MNPLKHIFILILLLLAGLQVEAAHGEGSKTAGDFKYCLLNDSFSQPAWELDLFAYFIPNQEQQKYRDTTSQYISPCAQILEEEVFASPPGSLAPKVLCMLAEDLAKFPELRKLFDSAENVGGKFVRAWEKLIRTGLRTVDNWLRIVSIWLDEGVTVVDNVLPVKFLHNGQEIARIVDDKLIPTKFQFEGTVINEVKLPNQTFGKDVVKAADGTIGFRYQFQKTKIYRAMSNAEWQAVQTNQGLSIGSGTENFVSTSRAYSEGILGKPGYDVLVEFTVEPKTVQDLAKIGVRNEADLIFRSGFDDLTPVSSGWSSTKAFFKGEGEAVNIGLGAQSVNIFNGNITTFVRLN